MTKLAWVFVGLWMLPACSAKDTSEPAPEGGSETGDGGATGTTGNDASSETGTSDDGSEDATGDDSGFIERPDAGGVPGECDLYAQDCPEGERCNTDGESWGCVPIVENPVAVGDACERGAGWGEDNCGLGATCMWQLSPDYGDACVELCRGSDVDPTCGPGRGCHPYNNGMLPLCIDACDPLVQDCAGQRGCYIGVTGFACLPDHSEGGGGFEAPCLGPYECAPGLACLDASAAGCDGNEYCCTPFCDVDAANECPGDSQQCVTLGFPDFDHVGVCVAG